MARPVMTANTEPTSTSTSTEQILQAVADPRRRRVLRHLVAHGESPLPVEELAQRIADEDQPITGEKPAHRLVADNHPAMDRLGSVEAIRIRLHHLPQLAASGVVGYDPSDNRVRYHSQEAVEDLLQFIATRME